MNNITMGRMIAATPRILPAVYEDAMTYIEQLRILDAKLNEVIDVFNSYGDELLLDSKKYTDEQILALGSRVDEQLAEMKNQIDNGLADLETTLNNELEEFRTKADAEFAWFRQRADELFQMFVEETNKLNERITQLQIAVNTFFDALSRTKTEIREEMNNRFEEIVTWLEQSMAAKSGDQIIVKNPITKRLTSLNVALESIVDVFQMMFALTVNEYKSLNLTANVYKDKKITANAYLMQGRWIFFHQLYFPDLDQRFEELYSYVDKEAAKLVRAHYMISPFSGTSEPISKIVYELARLHMRGITAAQYRDALVKAQTYHDMQISAHDYAWNGYYIINTGAIPPDTLEEMVRQMQLLIGALENRVKVLENEAVPSETLAYIQNKIVEQRKDFTQFTKDQADTDAAQDQEIQTNARDIEHLEDVTIPEAIEGLNNTFGTVTTGLQKQVTEITSGLQSIHINYNTSTFANKVRKARKAGKNE